MLVWLLLVVTEAPEDKELTNSDGPAKRLQDNVDPSDTIVSRDISLYHRI